MNDTYSTTGSPTPSDFLLGTLTGLGAEGRGKAVGPLAFVMQTYRPDAEKKMSHQVYGLRRKESTVTVCCTQNKYAEVSEARETTKTVTVMNKIDSIMFNTV